ncbi:FlhF incomplete domain containing protein [Pandoravirus japonicus]|uniref:FlhF incomplete domain containing protein n=1 Tax=Pandoravirus japonicus TaxID=2823154 RepID=A0A811BLY0_9VIRU|nr:FlhF incomplete domain containing protein [Pandoravirus japonicus]
MKRPARHTILQPCKSAPDPPTADCLRPPKDAGHSKPTNLKCSRSTSRATARRAQANVPQHTQLLPSPPPSGPHADAQPRAPFSVCAFRHFLRGLPPTATVDLADEPPIVVMDSARLRASYVMFTRGSTVAARLLVRLGIAGPFDHLPAVPVRASAPPVTGAQTSAGGARLCHPKRERVTSSCAARPLPTVYDVCCEAILDRARAAYRAAGPVAATNAVADVSSVLASTAPVDVALYACGATLVTRDVALGMLALGESRSDVDAAYACVAWTVLPHGSVGVYERRS